MAKKKSRTDAKIEKNNRRIVELEREIELIHREMAFSEAECWRSFALRIEHATTPEARKVLAEECREVADHYLKGTKYGHC